MVFCGKCGTKVEEGVRFCPGCGNPMAAPDPRQAPPQQEWSAPNQNNFSANYGNPGNSAEVFDKDDIEKNKVMGLLAYILFLIPLLAAKDSPYAKFHTNQGLVLFIAAMVVSVVGSIIPILGWFVILPIGCLIVGVLGIIGIINALTGKAKELPMIGKIKILK